MKMVKSLLLGSAAGLVAVASAQAADLPVKAKPVEYVKVCSLYGAGFFYIPGTDICIKMGGYVRYQAYYGSANSSTTGQLVSGNAMNRVTGSDYAQRVRAVMTMDTRAQTEYGTVRTYFLLGVSQDTNRYSGLSINFTGSTGSNGAAAGLYANRAFIQWAGFTFGKAQSFYDIFSSPAVTYFSAVSSDTGDGGVTLAAYTWQWGNGISTTVSTEDPRGRGAVSSVINGSLGASVLGLGAVTTAADTSVRWPDIVLNTRVDQAWGSWQVMGALHDVSGSYYAGNVNGLTCANGIAADYTIFAAGALSMNCGAPADKIGWSIGTGAVINAGFINPGDKFQFQFDYAEGATRYLIASNGGQYGAFSGANSYGFGYLLDGVYANGTGVHLTKGYRLAASYDHLWTPNLKTSVYGTYLNIQYDQTAAAVLCQSMSGAISLIGVAPATCSQDWNLWQVGTRTQWNIRPDFYLGVDILYAKLESASSGQLATITGSATTGRNTGVYQIQDQDSLAVQFRAHRDIVP